MSSIIYYLGGQVLNVTSACDLVCIKAYDDDKPLGIVKVRSATTFVPITIEGARRRSRSTLRAAIEALIPKEEPTNMDNPLCPLHGTLMHRTLGPAPGYLPVIVCPKCADKAAFPKALIKSETTSCQLQTANHSEDHGEGEG